MRPDVDVRVGTHQLSTSMRSQIPAPLDSTDSDDDRVCKSNCLVEVFIRTVWEKPMRHVYLVLGNACRQMRHNDRVTSSEIARIFSHSTSKPGPL